MLWLDESLSALLRFALGYDKRRFSVFCEFVEACVSLIHKRKQSLFDTSEKTNRVNDRVICVYDYNTR
jgi:hypothetical protein